MYRQYEDPYRLEKKLAELKERQLNATDDGELEYLAEEIAELEERVNFAWQDDEYESDHSWEDMLEDLYWEQHEQM